MTIIRQLCKNEPLTDVACSKNSLLQLYKMQCNRNNTKQCYIHFRFQCLAECTTLATFRSRSYYCNRCSYVLVQETSWVERVNYGWKFSVQYKVPLLSEVKERLKRWPVGSSQFLTIKFKYPL